MFSVPRFIERAAEFSARGRTTQKSVVTPMEYSREVTSAISDERNGVYASGKSQKVLDASIPIIGGKGWGDVYMLGFHAAEGLLSANGLVKAATLANTFARTANSTMDSAGLPGLHAGSCK